MIGGDTGTPSRKLTGPGHADADAGRAVDALLGEQLPGQREGVGQHGLGSAADVGSPAYLAGEHAQPAVGDRDVDRGGAHVDADEAQPGVEVDERGASTAAGRGGSGLGSQAEVDQPVDLRGHGRAGDVEPRRQLHPGQRAVVAEVAQDAGLVGRLRAPRQGVCHPGIVPATGVLVQVACESPVGGDTGHSAAATSATTPASGLTDSGPCALLPVRPMPRSAPRSPGSLIPSLPRPSWTAASSPTTASPSSSPSSPSPWWSASSPAPVRSTATP